MLKLGTYPDLTDQEIIEDLIKNYAAKPEELKDIEILVAVNGDYGWEESSWFLLRKNGVLMENHASHCSCMGYEGQWTPEPTTLEYLMSDKFSFSPSEYNEEVKSWLQENLG